MKFPQFWDVKQVKELAYTTAGGTPFTGNREFWGGNIPWMNSGELNLKTVRHVEGRITEKGLENSSTKLIPKHCVLIGLAGQGKTRGTVATNEIELCTNQSIAAIFPGKAFDYKYLYYNLEFRYQELRELSDGGGGRGGLNLFLINNLEIPLPNLSEQKAIAEALSDVDELINISTLEISKLENLVAGYLSEVFRVTEDAQEFKLEDVIQDINDGGTPSTQNKRNFGGNIPWVVIEDISPQIYRTKTTLSDLGVKNSSAIIWPAGSLILSTGATIGEVGVAMTPMATKQGICGIVFDDSKTSTAFMRLWFMKNRSLLESFAQGSTIKEIRPPLIKQLKATIPNLDRQDEIVSKVSDLEANLKSLRDELQKYEWLKQGMMNDLLTGKVRLV